ncbi:MAG: hypothetical protein KC983_10410 [Phycisphaerales bacterium]|nr:hypothetical protein [Phycisphaerales bacterium]
MDDESTLLMGACPHIDRDDHRCSSRFCLGRINQAFSVCFGAYKACPMFHSINRECAAVVDKAVADQTETTVRRSPPLVHITAHGSSLTLRATGT